MSPWYSVLDFQTDNPAIRESNSVTGKMHRGLVGDFELRVTWFGCCSSALPTSCRAGLRRGWECQKAFQL